MQKNIMQDMREMNTFLFRSVHRGVAFLFRNALICNSILYIVLSETKCCGGGGATRQHSSQSQSERAETRESAERRPLFNIYIYLLW